MAEPTTGESSAERLSAIGSESVASDDEGDSAFRSAAMSDQPSERDLLDFDRYVQALLAFLLHVDTKPPLAVSIEGGWGSGKSSFMRQLRVELEGTRQPPKWRLLPWLTSDTDHVTVTFNPWRHDTEDSLWAAFTLSFLEQVRRQRPFPRRVVGHLRLVRSRIDVSQKTTDLSVRVLATLVAAAVVLVGLVVNLAFDVVDSGDLGTAGELAVSGGVGGLVLAVAGWVVKSDAIDRTRNELDRYLKDPEYEGHVSLIERVHDDLERVLDAYVGDRCVFVFVDDLDRCEVPRSAELMQAINLLLSNDDRMVFLLALDREKVAASVAVKHESSLKYLVPDGATEYGLTYGFNYLEKFVQIPFQVPTPRGEHIVSFVDKLLTGESLAGGEGTSNADVVVDEWDRGRVILMVLFAAPAMEYNPRRIKRFLNLYRLRALLATQAGLLSDEPGDGVVTLEQLGKFVSITLLWPRLLSTLAEDPNVLGARYDALLRDDLRRRWRSDEGRLTARGGDDTDTDDGDDGDDVPEIEPDGGDDDNGGGEDGRDDPDGDDTDEVAPDPHPDGDDGQPSVTTSADGALGYLSERSRRRLDDLLLAGVYEERPDGFDDLGSIVDPVDFAELDGRFRSPNFRRLGAFVEDGRGDELPDDVPGEPPKGVEEAIARLPIELLERLTDANTTYRVGGFEALLSISPRMESELAWVAERSAVKSGAHGASTEGQRLVVDTYRPRTSPDGDLDDEYVSFRNVGNAPVDLSGATVENTAGDVYRFPFEFVLEPNTSVRLYTGTGTDSDSELYWGAVERRWNASSDRIVLRDWTGSVLAELQYSERPRGS